MKSYYPLFILIALMLMLVRCNVEQPPKKENIDPFVSALPHGASPEESHNLSKEDLNKLGKAKGMTAEALEVSILSNKIKNAADALHVFVFWKADWTDSKKLIEQLDNIRQRIGEDKMRLILVNIDDDISETKLNQCIRQFPTAYSNFKLKAADRIENAALISAQWNGKDPCFLVANRTNATNSFFKNSYKLDELYAILQPLAL